MTREEAIKSLNEIKECPIGLKAWYIVALEMAIQALSQESQCTEHPCLGTLCRYYKEPCDDAISQEKEPCDECIFEEGSKYCIEHCPHEAKVDKQINNFNKNTSKNIAQMFADFVNSFEYDAYEIAMVCSQVLNENNVKFNCTKHLIGIDIFTDSEMESEE